MGIYSHLSTEELRSTRDLLLAALTSPSEVMHNGRRVTARPASEIRRELNDITDELRRREGAASARGPIYLV